MRTRCIFSHVLTSSIHARLVHRSFYYRELGMQHIRQTYFPVFWIQLVRSSCLYFGCLNINVLYRYVTFYNSVYYWCSVTTALVWQLILATVGRCYCEQYRYLHAVLVFYHCLIPPLMRNDEKVSMTSTTSRYSWLANNYGEPLRTRKLMTPSLMGRPGV